MFTTHYHWLVDDFRGLDGIQLYTMQFDHDKPSQEDNDMHYEGALVKNASHRKIRFLYRFEKGVANSSFGVSVAEMAGIPRDVVDKAEKVSTGFNKTIDIIKKRIKDK